MNSKTTSTRKPIKILIAEDSPTQAEQLRHLLEENGYKVTVAADGEQAMAAIAKEKQDIVISDIVMPGMDGYSLCKRIKSKPEMKDTPVILVTSLSSPQDIIRGLECGADNFVTKPYEGNYLLSRIQYILTNRELRTGEKMQVGAEIVFSGKKYFITSERQQILDLLLSTYETAVEKNLELIKSRDELKQLNEQLEEKVKERTADLTAEVAERKRAEREIRRLNAELEQRVIERTAELEVANKELEAFSYSVSHDLRAPLRAIDGFSGILLQQHGAQMSPEAQRYQSLIRANVRQMARLIDDLLSFSRLSRQPLKRELVAPAEIVRQALDDLGHEQTNRQISVKELLACHADPALLKQVFVNLLSNAIKYTSRREAALVQVGCFNSNGETVYFVKDNGVGFDMKYADKLFGVFQRFHRAEEYEGTGVGLAIVQRIVHRHGGRVWAEAEVDKGATFNFTLGGGSTC
jgi:two-component system sensor histidine kinase/response regulator